MRPQRAFSPLPLATCLSAALIVLCPAGLCLAGQDPGQGPTPAPFSPDETQHGFSQIETMPLVPEETAPDPLDYYRNEYPGSLRSRDRSADGPPGGLFRQITLAHNFEEEMDVRHGHLYSPVRPAETFASDTSAVYVVFRVFKHYAAYHVIGHMVPERVPGFSGETVTDEDTASLALEDESGYLKFFAPSQEGQASWRPGRYRIDIFVGFEASELTRMGTLRFTIAPRA